MTLDIVEQLKKIIKTLDVSIIVVDNASPNESGEVLKKASKNDTEYIFIQSEENRGYASGNNIGIIRSQKLYADYVLVINNDIVIESEDTIQKLISLMESQPSAGAVSPRIVCPDKRRDPPLYFAKPSFWDLTFGIRAFHKKRYKFNEDRNVQIYAPRGSCMLLRNSMLRAINNLDESTFLYYEEPILAERLKNISAGCWHCGEATVIHNHAVTINSSLNKKRIANTLCESYKHYLKSYRKMGAIKTLICLWVRKLAFMRR